VTTPPVTVDVDAAGLAVVTIDHPPLNLYDDALHAALRDAGIRRAASYTWERCAAATIAAYRLAMA